MCSTSPRLQPFQRLHPLVVRSRGCSPSSSGVRVASYAWASFRASMMRVTMVSWLKQVYMVVKSAVMRGLEERTAEWVRAKRANSSGLSTIQYRRRPVRWWRSVSLWRRERMAVPSTFTKASSNLSVGTRGGEGLALVVELWMT